MRTGVLVLALFVLGAATSAAQQLGFHSPDAHPIVTTDPSAYVQDLDTRIAAHGMEPLREVFTSMFGEVPPDVSRIVLTYDGYVGHQPARSWQMIDDISLSNRLRSIYTLHVFSSHQFLFTRVDFIRVDDANWAMNNVTFGSAWPQVAGPVTPGFTETARPQ